jgi:prepilin-type N-terminal cleavage/methylation domain-containing protein
MFRKHRKKLNKRGFTLAEAVLALAVISITSVGVLSLVLFSQRSTVTATHKQQAQLYAADIINCYRVSSTTTDFATNVKYALNQEEVKKFDLTDIKLNNHMTASVTFNGKTITVTVTEDDGKKLTELTFTKGVALNESNP